MFWNRYLLYKGTSIQKYNEIINILQTNDIKYTIKIRNKNSYIGPMMDKVVIGTLGQKEDFSNEYSIFVNKEKYEYAKYIVEKFWNILSGFIEKGDVYALVLEENNKVIGSLGIHKSDRCRQDISLIQREIGYVLNKDYWGKGLMGEAIGAAIKYAFEELKVDLLWCGHFNFNSQSQKVIEKSGFKFHSDAIYKAELLGKSFDEKVYIIDKDMYINKK